MGIQSIVSIEQNGTSSNLLTSGILEYIDSRVPEIWLPIDACQAFERAFNLTYDNASKLYVVDSAQPQVLLAQKANVSFTLGHTENGGDTVVLTLPYDSFDLYANPPKVAERTRYFPLRRARNATQYILGRTFLQET